MKSAVAIGDPIPVELKKALDFAGFEWIAATTAIDSSAQIPEEGCGVALVVAADDDTAPMWAHCATLRRAFGSAPTPIIVLIGGHQLDDLHDRDDLYDDFCVVPFHPSELLRRIAHAQAIYGQKVAEPQLVRYDGLVLNVDSYQAAVDSVPVELTYMEYELLKFLASNPGKVFSREVLLSEVWGYDYFGGARTVDVHIRRLRVKLGEKHSALIQTVRSVGYCFGESHWP